ncbi:hypothetical protein RchiOBHm_Chr3g0472951 [Rosa chinensis]|uniref:Uncharacterized protein n=1 Tax=Rosa chinensis TaxID=74649 RepID=A0A2P6RBR1_ROSCH|nr:hypothetical protein RchiOBHm_Chr3g0472951 [Rosa chinensis]
METFMDLLGVAGRRPCLPMVVCCSSHDELDAVSSTIATVPYISLAPLEEGDAIENQRKKDKKLEVEKSKKMLAYAIIWVHPFF